MKTLIIFCALALTATAYADVTCNGKGNNDKFSVIKRDSKIMLFDAENVSVQNILDEEQSQNGNVCTIKIESLEFQYPCDGKAGEGKINLDDQELKLDCKAQAALPNEYFESGSQNPKELQDPGEEASPRNSDPNPDQAYDEGSDEEDERDCSVGSTIFCRRPGHIGASFTQPSRAPRRQQRPDSNQNGESEDDMNDCSVGSTINCRRPGQIGASFLPN